MSTGDTRDATNAGGIVKISVIGGGSVYTPELVQSLLSLASELSLRELWLMDIDDDRLAKVGGLAQRLVLASGSPFSVVLSGSREEALKDSDFVLCQIRVGGITYRIKDELLCRRWGLAGQETIGAAAFANALRSVPVAISIAEDMRRLCPDAWLINFANPSGLLTEALQRHIPEIRSLGLCNNPINQRRKIASYLSVEPMDVRLKLLGLNHLTWLTGVKVKGEDAWPEVFRMYLDELEQDQDPYCPAYLARALGAIPNSYLKYYYRNQRMVEGLANAPRTRGEIVSEIEGKLMALYADPNVTQVPPELAKRGGTFYSVAATQLIDALHNDLGLEYVVNVPNGGAAPGWPADWVCEMGCRVDASGAHPVEADPIPFSAQSLVYAMKAFEILTVEAAISGDRDKAVEALVANPIGPDADQAWPLLEDLLAENSDFLPRFR
jgi:6-phospho-beta-glucosidase